jgi:hypothetical protein
MHFFQFTATVTQSFSKFIFFKFIQQDKPISNKPIPKYTPTSNTPHNPVRVTLF